MGEAAENPTRPRDCRRRSWSRWRDRCQGDREFWSWRSSLRRARRRIRHLFQLPIRRRQPHSSKRIARIRSGARRISVCGIRSAANRCAGNPPPAHPAQNFLKHSLPVPCSNRQSLAVTLALASGVISTKKLLLSLQRMLQYAYPFALPVAVTPIRKGDSPTQPLMPFVSIFAWSSGGRLRRWSLAGLPDPSAATAPKLGPVSNTAATASSLSKVHLTPRSNRDYRPPQAAATLRRGGNLPAACDFVKSARHPAVG